MSGLSSLWTGWICHRNNGTDREASVRHVNGGRDRLIENFTLEFMKVEKTENSTE